MHGKTEDNANETPKATHGAHEAPPSLPQGGVEKAARLCALMILSDVRGTRIASQIDAFWTQTPQHSVLNMF
jgi:hypothetical protein